MSKVVFGFAAALLSLIVIGGLFLGALTAKVELSDVAIDAYDVIHQLENLLSDVSAAESSALEYSLAGQQHYLDQYKINLSTIHRDLDLLRHKVSDDPSQSKQMMRVESLLDEKLRLLEQLARLRHELPPIPGHLIQEDNLVRQGNRAMEDVRAAIEAMQDEADRTLSARLQEMEGARTKTSTWLLATTLLATGIVGWLFVMVHRETTQRMRVQEALLQSNVQLENRVQERTLQLSFTNNRLCALSRQVIQAQEQERRHIARDLHDEIGHSLTAVKLNLKEIESRVEGTPAEPLVRESIEVLGLLLQRVRRLAVELRPALLDEFGLREASKWYVMECAKRAGLAIAFEAETPWEHLPEEIEIACFRVLQEALTNVRKHAGATSVTVRLKQTPESLALKIRDNGIGFSPTESRLAALRGESFGLVGMEERLRLLGGTLAVVSAVGEGTEVEATFPLKRKDAAKSALEETTA